MDIRQSLAQGGPIILSDVTYTIDPSGPGVEGLFSAWLIENAQRRVEAVLRTLPPAKQAEYRSSFIGQVGSGEYEWGGIHAAKAVATVPGLAYYLWLRMRKNHSGLTHAQVEKLLIDNQHVFLEQAQLVDQNPTNGTSVTRVVE
jgi:hypothetical protein